MRLQPRSRSSARPRCRERLSSGSNWSRTDRSGQALTPRPSQSCRENLGPEPRELAVMLLAGAHPHDAERRDVRRQPDGEGREDDVPNDGEGELEAGNEERIELHEINPRTSASSPLVKLTRRERLTGPERGHGRLA